ncbi:MAG: DNA-directed RNA polymerase subunit omega [Armatimonadota bacterium]|nr:MAG: DNA-directed RNA polymerase subunit omega [Armatimonadota bacterium]
MRIPDSGAEQDKEVEVDKLARKLGKYTLVVAVAKRAREMKERTTRAPLGPSPASYIERALRDVEKGQVKIVRSREEQA